LPKAGQEISITERKSLKQPYFLGIGRVKIPLCMQWIKDHQIIESNGRAALIFSYFAYILNKWFEDLHFELIIILLTSDLIVICVNG